MRQQFFHILRAMRSPQRRIARLALAVVTLSGAVPVRAQTPQPVSTYRVFLKSGQALPSYGEAATVDGRLVFNLSVGGPSRPLALQLMSLPLDLVDVERTNRYTESVRAAFFAATKGEAEYAALTASVRQDLQQLSVLDNRPLQILMAELVRQRLLAWPKEHHYYRAADVEKLAGLVGDVVNELKPPGERTFALELSAGPAEPVRETLLPAPSLREAIELSLSASAVADVEEDRLGVLRVASSIVPADDPALRGLVLNRLDQEREATVAYGALAADIRTRSRAATAAGDAPAFDRLETELIGRDRQLESRRPGTTRQLLQELRLARSAIPLRPEIPARPDVAVLLDAPRPPDMPIRPAGVRQRLLAYERAVRPGLSALDGLRSVLEYFRDRRQVSFERTVAAQQRLERLRAAIELVAPPPEVAAVHSTLVSALRMASEACALRREAAATNAAHTFREASSAAAGALLLADRSRSDLVEILCLGGRVATCAQAR
jgi:hypothetical protein